MISVVIPTLNEASRLADLLPRLLRESADLEIIVTDGGSTDESSEVVNALPVIKWRSGEPGRARQLQAGADAATGDILLFLHADTILPSGWSQAISQTSQAKDFAIGAFRFKLDTPIPGGALIEFGVNLRCRLFRRPYGDQALFMKTDTFRKAGGMRELPIMEDVDLVQRMRKHGRLVMLREPAITSARRWQHVGALRQTWMNLSTYALYRLGRSPEELAHRYRRTSRAVVVFCKYPTPGTVKTRLAATIGDDEAARIYRQMVQSALKTVRETRCGASTLVFFAPAEARDDMANWLGSHHTYQPQVDGDLGDRMLQAFRYASANGIRQTVIIGTDCPGLTSNILQETFNKLDNHDIVLGPTPDGGYYLIGANQPHPELFRDIAWSTEKVFPQTMKRIQSSGLSCVQLEKLRDVDTIDDLNHYPSHQLNPTKS